MFEKDGQSGKDESVMWLKDKGCWKENVNMYPLHAPVFRPERGEQE